MSNRTYLFILLTIMIIAIAFRAPNLDMRPMHGDEAVHAIKFAKLLEKGEYTYDPHEYHGPTLNYFTLFPAWITGKSNLAKITEITLRIVPLFFGLLIILMLLFLKTGLDKSTIIFASVLSAISPAMVFYSRYYIQEMLLVCFAFGGIVSAYRFFKSQHIGWAIGSGVFLGLMHATKETWILFVAAMILSLFLVRGLSAGFKISSFWQAEYKKPLLIAFVAYLIVSATFFSSFFTNLDGIVDAFATYATYLNRASENQWHLHPWYYYLELFTYFKVEKDPAFTEIFIIILAIIGFVAIMRKTPKLNGDYRLYQFIAFYTLFLTIIFSLIPYKTPWNALGFWHGIILLAGIGCAFLLRWKPNKKLSGILYLLVVLGFIHLAWKSYQINFEYYASPANPHVYAHPTTDALAVSDEIEKYSLADSSGKAIYIEAIFPGGDYWPFPWYLRDFSRVGWWSGVNENTPAAPIIICSPDVEEALTQKLYFKPPPGQRHLYVPMFDHKIELRPNVEMKAYVRKDLWDKVNTRGVSF